MRPVPPVQPLSPLVYLHPALAVLGLLLAFVAYRQGLVQRAQRVKKRPAPPANLKQHVALGPLAAALMVVAVVGGLASTVLVRGWAPLATWHGRLGLVGAGLFAALWWLGRRLVRQDKSVAAAHGLLGVVGLFACGIAALLGIELLP